MPTYATPADLAEYITGDPLTEPPALSVVLLRSAASLVAQATRAAVYRVDADELPIDLKLRAALKEATLAQAAAWEANKLNPSLGRAQVTPAVASKSIGGVSVSYQQAGRRDAALSDLASGDYLVGEAYRVLGRAGLLSTNVLSRPGAAGRHYDLTPSSPFVLGEGTLGT